MYDEEECRYAYFVRSVYASEVLEPNGEALALKMLLDYLFSREIAKSFFLVTL
jgi:hypothetical protein